MSKSVTTFEELVERVGTFDGTGLASAHNPPPIVFPESPSRSAKEERYRKAAYAIKRARWALTELEPVPRDFTNDIDFGREKEHHKARLVKLAEIENEVYELMMKAMEGV